jgi:hypothetical protein
MFHSNTTHARLHQGPRHTTAPLQYKNCHHSKNTQHYQERKPGKTPQNGKKSPQNQQEQMRNNIPWCNTHLATWQENAGLQTNETRNTTKINNIGNAKN